MTFELLSAQQYTPEECTRSSSDVLADFKTTDQFEEARTPGALRTPLKTFMNLFTDEVQRNPDCDWRGGLLADDMGLGKTLSIIALIASDKDPRDTNSSLKRHNTQAQELASTLVIVPFNLIEVWISQLRTHVYEGELTCIVFSAWTTSLDMVERGLGNDVGFVRIDGKVAKTKRDHAIQKLREDPNIRVILITISCGACGAFARATMESIGRGPSTRTSTSTRPNSPGHYV
ncbi:hypothetical protein N0V83_000083 [Neocucurbitaria cava]|uniref:SNF2 N-terminal domain-containing protein n=1 Tax=Neocucurbitaria cava TaxID=798079 RepID=A0A9W8YFP6_9PLEO|nr:hypothetical protein N0V83_000083 [Neocucurbitaria cava]